MSLFQSEAWFGNIIVAFRYRSDRYSPSIVTHLFVIDHSSSQHLHWANGNKRGTATVLKDVTGGGVREEDLRESRGGFQPVNRGGDCQNRWNLGMNIGEGRKGCTWQDWAAIQHIGQLVSVNTQPLLSLSIIILMAPMRKPRLRENKLPRSRSFMWQKPRVN